MKDKAKQAAAARRHYEKNRPAMIERSKACTEEKRRRHREIVRAAKAVPCTDCGIQYPYYVMQFDHVRGTKDFNIGDNIINGCSTERLLDEIAKCEVVCANCHAIRTHTRTLGV